MNKNAKREKEIYEIDSDSENDTMNTFLSQINAVKRDIYMSEESSRIEIDTQRCNLQMQLLDRISMPQDEKQQHYRDLFNQLRKSSSGTADGTETLGKTNRE